MAFLIGTDEAGYGPNLGPLVISATVWKVADDQRERDLYDLLGGFVRKEAARRDDLHLAIADSKQLYKSGSGLVALERGVLSSLMVLGFRCSSWRGVWRAVAPESERWLDALPWHAGYDCTLPREALAGDIERLSAGLAGKLHDARASLCHLRSVAVFPERWNELIEQYGSKGEALARETLDLLRRTLASLEASPALVQCDKLGGRNRYARLLQSTFPDDLVEVVCESRPLSVYRWGPKDRRGECRFVAKGERFLATALASMTSKYLRELAMLAFNDFWMRRLPGLQPTAGYPLDARRFKDQIRALQAELGIDDRVLWRER